MATGQGVLQVLCFLVSVSFHKCSVHIHSSITVCIVVVVVCIVVVLCVLLSYVYLLYYAGIVFFFFFRCRTAG